MAAEISDQLDRLGKIPRYFGDDITEQAIDDRREQMKKNLQIAESEPYFGRLDFQEDGKKGPDELYIGKVGVSKDASNELMVIDWRAPVASLFYSFNGGEEDIHYDSPEGLVEGDIHLKRNVVIRKAKLQRVVDSYVKGSDESGGTDEFLLYRLGDKKDNRLRDIVSTIQAEQNHIIRAEKNKPLIIQGVAGSGKTTVALHRLAFLLYHYRDYMSANQMVIFAPNRMFLDYISNVLPELGVGGIQQTTFPEWAHEIFGRKFRVRDDTADLSEYFSTHLQFKNRTNAGKIKGALTFKSMIDEAFSLYEQNLIPAEDFVLWDGCKIDRKRIEQWNEEQRHFPTKIRRTKIQKRLKAWIKEQVENQLPHERKERKKTADNKLRAFMKAWPDYDAFSFYKELFKKSHVQAFAQPVQHDLPEEIIEETRKRLNKKEVTAEDLPAMLWIHQKLVGKDKQFTYQHVVIDEAQDFSPFHIEVLKSNTMEDSFTILGDISQGIHSYKGIDRWQEFIDVFEGKNSQYVELKRSYRSTYEIIEYANRILENMKHTGGLAKPVFRSGEPVKEIQLGPDERIEKVTSIVKQMKDTEIDSIALVGRTAKDCEKLYHSLVALGEDEWKLITADQSEYKGGISIIPVYLTKGLEFDAVIMIDADRHNYQHNDRDAKLMYVGCTRALHQLWILHEEEITPLVGIKN
ncbi:AAA family ATPase [Alkalihalobacillus berkeleyi]|uniref:AAA family ATPase n=1 Tax=Pseudalkalibacillus berkeleyi TaxID=1069813 RepID=A0ABS9GXA6_9BACL|nr:3'-5' exonuclease [Pseudalkalibacillus berkeleyi]MCF6136218.1 AAA family ATPase [Pseudalkalibacillus berkeleyi]